MSEERKAPDADVEGREISKEDTSARTSLTLDDSPPAAEVNAPISFLKKFRPGGPWVLTSIVPDGRITTTTFRHDQLGLMEQWLHSRAGYENIYFQVNATGDKNVTKKTTKADIIAAEWLHVDIDGDREAAESALKSFQPRPQVVIDSGGGYQAFWRIASTDDLEDVEAVNRWIARELGGDHCYNIDRIMRLPGTINVPNKKKRRAGRVPVTARLVMFEGGLTDIAPLGRVNVEAASPIRAAARHVGSWDGPTDALFLCEALPPWAFRLLNDARDVNREAFPSRSEHLWAFVGACVRDGVAPELIRWCITNPAFVVSGHILDQNYPDRAADRTIARMEAACEQG